MFESLCAFYLSVRQERLLANKISPKLVFVPRRGETSWKVVEKDK